MTTLVWLCYFLLCLCVHSPSGAVSVPAVLQCHSWLQGTGHLYMHHLWISWSRGHMAQVLSPALISRIVLRHAASSERFWNEKLNREKKRKERNWWALEDERYIQNSGHSHIIPTHDSIAKPQVFNLLLEQALLFGGKARFQDLAAGIFFHSASGNLGAADARR